MSSNAPRSTVLIWFSISCLQREGVSFPERWSPAPLSHQQCPRSPSRPRATSLPPYIQHNLASFSPLPLPAGSPPCSAQLRCPSAPPADAQQRAQHHLYKPQEGPQAEHGACQGQTSQPLAGNSQDAELLQPGEVILVDPCDVVAVELPVERRGRDQRGSTQEVARHGGSPATPQKGQTGPKGWQWSLHFCAPRQEWHLSWTIKQQGAGAAWLPHLPVPMLDALLGTEAPEPSAMQQEAQQRQPPPGWMHIIPLWKCSNTL